MVLMTKCKNEKYSLNHIKEIETMYFTSVIKIKLYKQKYLINVKIVTTLNRLEIP